MGVCGHVLIGSLVCRRCSAETTAGRGHVASHTQWARRALVNSSVAAQLQHDPTLEKRASTNTF
jgi:hypothetical protein